MNKKLFAMMMVPVLVVMGGTFAFSAWEGQANAHFGQTAATVGYSETLSFIHTNATMNPLTLTPVPGTDLPVNSSTAPYQISSVSGGATSVLYVSVNVSGFVPGDWIQFTVNITNTGSAVLNTSEVGFSSGAVNGNGQIINPGQMAPISFLQPAVGMQYLLNGVNTGTFGSYHYTGLTWLVNATTDSSTLSHISNGQSISYTFFGILPKIAGGNTAGSNLQLTVTIPISVDQ